MIIEDRETMFSILVADLTDWIHVSPRLVCVACTWLVRRLEFGAQCEKVFEECLHSLLNANKSFFCHGSQSFRQACFFKTLFLFNGVSCFLHFNLVAWVCNNFSSDSSLPLLKELPRLTNLHLLFIVLSSWKIFFLKYLTASRHHSTNKTVFGLVFITAPV